MTYAQLFARLEADLLAAGEEKEALAFVFKAIKGWSQTDFILQQRQPVSEADQALLEDLAQQLTSHQPAQYLLGWADFHGLRLAVDSRVLIPRPETEELVDLILAENNQEHLSVLDMGTGSGAIALTLKAERPSWRLTGADISPDALEVAKSNARDLDLAVDFVQSDVFSQLEGTYDLIISNPPYIAWEDQAEVAVNVLTAEPHLALFADQAGLAIYQKLLNQAQNYLNPSGKIYLEIGYKQGKDLIRLSQTYLPGWRVRVLADAFGQDRMVVIDHG